MGVIGMNILEGDEVVGMQLNTQGDTLLIVSENGLGNVLRLKNLTFRTVVEKALNVIKLTRNPEM